MNMADKNWGPDKIRVWLFLLLFLLVMLGRFSEVFYMEEWKKSEGTFNLACDPQRVSGMMQNTCVKIEHVTKRFGEDIVLRELKSFLENRERLWDCWK